MRFKISAALVLPFASHLHASEIPATRTSTASGLDHLIPLFTPFPTPNLELRQNLGHNLHPSAAPEAGDQVPTVTVYSILTQIGATAKEATYTYTQTFAKVPDQFPAAVPGEIGFGNHKEKREVASSPVVNTGIAGRIGWRICGTPARSADGNSNGHGAFAEGDGGCGYRNLDCEYEECDWVDKPNRADGEQLSRGVVWYSNVPIFTDCFNVGVRCCHDFKK